MVIWYSRNRKFCKNHEGHHITTVQSQDVFTEHAKAFAVTNAHHYSPTTGHWIISSCSFTLSWLKAHVGASFWLNLDQILISKLPGHWDNESATTSYGNLSEKETCLSLFLTFFPQERAVLILSNSVVSVQDSFWRIFPPFFFFFKVTNDIPIAK